MRDWAIRRTESDCGMWGGLSLGLWDSEEQGRCRQAQASLASLGPKYEIISLSYKEPGPGRMESGRQAYSLDSLQGDRIRRRL